EGLANYFAVAQAISELEKANNIESLDAGLSVTPTGVKIARELELTLPITVRERAVNTAIRTLRLRKNAKENRVLIEPADGGYIVSCSVMDGEKELMTIRLLVGDGLQADRVKTQFLEDPLSVYASALSVMTGDYSLFDIAKKDAKNNKNKL
ncbi:MAG TPA: hypothetical protein DEQ02_07300, partial [Ruminococcaceae bacterium]|nr:hypothetical protein [Oscillospiraceae bacterium]